MPVGLWFVSVLLGKNCDEINVVVVVMGGKCLVAIVVKFELKCRRELNGGCLVQWYVRVAFKRLLTNILAECVDSL